MKITTYPQRNIHKQKWTPRDGVTYNQIEHSNTLDFRYIG